MTSTANGTGVADDARMAGGSAQSSAGFSGDIARGGGAVGDGAGRAVAVGVVPFKRPQLPSAAATEAATIIGMIERATASGASVDQIERMFSLYERAAARAAQAAFTQSLMRAKSQMPRIIKTGTITGNIKEGNVKVGTQKQSTYAKWEEVCSQIEPVLAANDLVLTFETEQPTLDRVSVTALLTHIDGHQMRSQMALPIENGGAKNNVQGWGSSVHYGKRYTAFAVLNLVGHDDKDNDGAGAPAEYITDAQQAELTALITETKTDITKFLEVGKVESLADITARGFENAKAMLMAKKIKAGKA